MPSTQPIAAFCFTVALLILPACAATPPLPQASAGAPAGNPEPAGNPDYDALFARAEREVNRAADAGFLWLPTEKYLAGARAARQAGNIPQAMKLAQKALDEALLAQKQAAEGANAKADYSYRR